MYDNEEDTQKAYEAVPEGGKYIYQRVDELAGRVAFDNAGTNIGLAMYRVVQRA